MIIGKWYFIQHTDSKKYYIHTASIQYTSMFLEIGRFQWKQLLLETAVTAEIFQRTLTLKVPPHKLVQKDRINIHKQALAYIKSEFSMKVTLPCFSKDKEMLHQTDTSKKGFGAVLIQDNKPVYFTSRKLTPGEKNYLYGGHFTLQSNQKPQRIAIHSWQYNFNAVWIKGKSNMIKDI